MKKAMGVEQLKQKVNQLKPRREMPEKLIYITEQNLRDAEKNRNATVDTDWLKDLNHLYNNTHPNV